MSVVYILTLCCLVSCWSRERATSCESLIVTAILALGNVCDNIYYLLVKLIKLFFVFFFSLSIILYIASYQLW